MSSPSFLRGGLTRRRFVTSLAAGGVATAFARPALAGVQQAGAIPAQAATQWQLTVAHTHIEIDRKSLKAPCIGGSVPAPTLRWRQGDTVEIAVTNHLKHQDTSLHWHGIRLPAQMDGVPGISFAGISPGQTFTYRFPVTQSGTYWYHGHSGMQEAQGLYGALVIDPTQPDPNACPRDYVIMLSEWTDVDPQDILNTLKMQSDYYTFRQRTAASLLPDAKAAGGVIPALKDRLAWSKMRMAATDISDVSGIIYSYLLNGQAPDTNWLGLFTPGERVRLRFINASSMTFFDVRIPGLELLVVQADGNDIEPVPVDEFRIGVAETYDVIVQPKANQAYTIFAQSEDRTGFARGTLAPRAGMSAPIPPLDPRPVRTMVDMGMGTMQPGQSMQTMQGMPGMAMPPHTPMATLPAAPGAAHGASAPQHTHAAMPMAATPHPTAPNTTAPVPTASTPKAKPPAQPDDTMDMSGMDMSDMDMPGMDMGGMSMPSRAHTSTAAHSPHAMPPSNTTSQTAHSGGHTMGHHTGPIDQAVPPATPSTAPPLLQVDDPGPPPLNVENQNIAAMPTDRLGSPGDGLEHNGRRVLTYKQLRATRPGTDPRPPTREIILHLTGNMERYIWGFNGRKFSESGPIRLKKNERVRFTLINDTMMEHPIHLHGMWSELENGQGAYQPYKHTIIAQPGSKLSYLVTADAPGMWAYHCHLMLHMDQGMFRTVIVA
ncbi:copper resistance protein CopA [Acetobacter orientalis]|nr:copper resistance system multicopper oxidase [Acetobacter orientalis]OUJ17384.1 copper resistance protein CopA [Acetobacter orientalis]